MTRTKTHLTFLVDASGSMGSIRQDVIGGVNAMIEDQRQETGKCRITIIAFDSRQPSQVIRDRVKLKDCKDLTIDEYQPRSMTPLLDAMGQAITRIEDKDDWQQIFAVYTDGMENASKEYTTGSLKALVESKIKDHEWVFTYLGAGQDAFAQAQSMGVPTANASSLNLGADSYRGGTQSVSTMTRGVRRSRAGGQSVQVDDVYASTGVEKPKE